MNAAAHILSWGVFALVVTVFALIAFHRFDKMVDRKIEEEKRTGQRAERKRRRKLP